MHDNTTEYGGNLKIKVEQVNRYDVTIGNKVHKDFECKDEWNGFIKLVGKEGVIFATEISDGNMFSFFQELTGEKTKSTEYIMVKASPNLLPLECNVKSNESSDGKDKQQ